MKVKKQQLELDMEQQTGSTSGKEFIKAALIVWHITYAASGVAAGDSFPVEVLMKSAPE